VERGGDAMNKANNHNKPPLCIDEYPLSKSSARKILLDIANYHSNRVLWSKHVKTRMVQRDITSRQIISLLRNRHMVFTEGPYEQPNGDWKFNIKGLAAGTIIELVIVLKNHQFDPKSLLVTVWVV